MRKILFGLFIFQSIYCSADAWDNLSYEEAELVVAYLEEHPYILDYCDCCSHDGKYAAEVFLLKVTKASIVNCNWSEGEYSVEVEYKTIAQIPYLEDGIDIILQLFS